MAKKILVVDDEPEIAEFLKDRLEMNGYDVSMAYDGAEALEKTKEIDPDLIISDVNMPSPNGFQVCRTLKDDAKYKDTPIILLTAKTSESDKFWGVESGADEYITKPYNAEDLLEKVKNLLEE